jgi:Caudovirales tail fibre assembly protein, lambda gpK
MKSYARLDHDVVVEIITPPIDLEGNQYSIDVCYTPEFVATCIEVTNIDPQPEQGWVYNGVAVAPAPPYVPTQEEILSRNQARQASLLADASQAMTPLMVSLNLGDATEEETVAAKAWQAYYRALKQLDVASPEPDWPVTPE